MSKIAYQNLPSTATPLNATNLNNMQDVIETGTAETGKWIKFDDGVLVQYGNINLGNINYDRQAGSIYENSDNANIYVLQYPTQFYTVPDSVVSAVFSNGYMGHSLNTFHKSRVNFYTFRYSSGTLSNVTLSYFAIGRWKA